VTVANYADLKARCEEGGNEIILSDPFDASGYAEIIISDEQTCVVRGQGLETHVLDAAGQGRFFSVTGGSSLTIYGLVLKDGFNGEYVSSSESVPRNFLVISAPIPGGGHATSRVGLFMLRAVPMWRSMTPPSRATLPD
jgi:hypothetical protein